MKLAKVIFNKFFPSIFKRSLIQLYIHISSFWEKILVYSSINNNKNAIESLRKKRKIKIVFFVVHSSVWKYDILYKLLEIDELFEPVIVICPYVIHGEEIMLEEMEKSFAFFKNRHYNVLRSLDDNNKKWLRVSKDLKPDIILLTNPYNLTHKEYYIKNLLKYVTCYVPYGYMITDRPKMQYDELLHNLVSRFYLESNYHKSQAVKFSRCKGNNVMVTGYPGLDDLLFPSKDIGHSVWKNAISKRKKIIWAPHHTIFDDGSNFIYSNFIEFSQIMLDILKKYKKDIEIAFKPHPILKANLYKHKDWGKLKTDEYYSIWEHCDNSQLNESGYVDLFLTSDAMIFDSGSFIIEYLAANKPSLYQLRQSSLLDGFSELGKKAINCHYKAYNQDELIHFIEDVVISGNDTLKAEREFFVREFLLPPHNKMASENIYVDLCNMIGKI